MATKKISDSGLQGWITDELPDLSGKKILITGGNSGIGLCAAKDLAKAGADIIITSRTRAKAEAAVSEINTVGKGRAEFVLLDLADLSNVRECAFGIQERHPRLDALVCNAGICGTPHTLSPDGYELQFATNHLGHFLLSAGLLSCIEASAGRIVVVSSYTHKGATLDLDDLMMEQSYSPLGAYARSKLANLMFMRELDRRLKEAGSTASVVGCHPGYAATNLQVTGPQGSVFPRVLKYMTSLLAQRAEFGAIPISLAAAGKEALPGGYYGPVQYFENRGRIGDALISDKALDTNMNRELWEKSEKLVGQAWSL